MMTKTLEKLESQPWLIAIAAVVVQLCLGTISAWSVGTMLTAWGAAGVFSPLIFAAIKANFGSYHQALYVASSLLILGFILSRMYKLPRKLTDIS